MADTQQIEQAWAQVHGQGKPEEGGIGQWLWEAIQGDFNEDRSAGQIAADMVISLIPIVDTICDIRDLCANIRAYRKDPSSKLTLFFIALTVVGFFPEIGSVIKGVVKIIFVYVRRYLKHADDLFDATKLGRATHAALDAALPKIAQFLSESRVVKWATKEGVPDIFKFCAKHLNELAAKIDPGKLKAKFLEGVAATEKLLGRIKYIVPGSTRDKLDDFLQYLGQQKQRIAGAIGQFTQPIRTILKLTAKRLDDHAWVAFTQTHNKGWIAPMSQQGAAQLMNKHPPKWVRLGTINNRAFTQAEADAAAANLVKDAIAFEKAHPGKRFPWQPLDSGTIQTFKVNSLGKAIVKGPAKLYRIVDPTNGAGGIFWIDEKTFNSLKTRADWREKLAVKPEWNQNGQYVVYEVPAGETLHVWRGPAASQKLDGTPYHLEGGADQIVFYPSPDRFAPTQPRIDPTTSAALPGRSGPDTRVEWKDATGRTVAAPIRSAPTDPRVKGPFETGWGFADWSHEEAQRIILALPDDVQ
jgi:hypothetical protein